MPLDDLELRRLHAEFEGVRNAYKATATAIKADPANRELRARLKKLEERHQRLRHRIENPDATPAPPPAPTIPPPAQGPNFDPAQFDIPASKVRPPVIVSGNDRSAGDTLKLAFKWFRRIGSVAMLLVLAVILVLISRQDLGFYEVPSSSMEPTLKPGDRFVALVASSYARGDVIVAKDPADPEAYIVKRIVATAGDWVRVYDGVLYVNDTVVTEPYLRERQIRYEMDPVHVDSGTVFLLGDDRNGSEDGHMWRRGVPLATVMGKARYIYKPSSRRGKLPSQNRVFAFIP